MNSNIYNNKIITYTFIINNILIYVIKKYGY